MSELVRAAVRERYIVEQEQRRAAMQRFIGSRRNRAVQPYSVDEVRTMRSGSRVDRLKD